MRVGGIGRPESIIVGRQNARAPKASKYDGTIVCGCGVRTNPIYGNGSKSWCALCEVLRRAAVRCN